MGLVYGVNQKVLKGILNKLKIEFGLAINGQESVDLMRENKYKIILMDLQMPVLNGIEASKIILEEFKDNPPYIIAISAKVFAEDRRECREIGMKDFIAKPFKVGKIKEALLRSKKFSS